MDDGDVPRNWELVHGKRSKCGQQDELIWGYVNSVSPRWAVREALGIDLNCGREVLAVVLI